MQSNTEVTVRKAVQQRSVRTVGHCGSVTVLEWDTETVRQYDRDAVKL
jgi:hypothetical protein